MSLQLRQVNCVAENDLELLGFLPLPPKCWNYRCERPHLGESSYVCMGCVYVYLWVVYVYESISGVCVCGVYVVCVWVVGEHACMGYMYGMFVVSVVYLWYLWCGVCCGGWEECMCM